MKVDPIPLLFKKDRLATFEKNWKPLKGFEHCTPENFAAAGFYNCSSKQFPDNVMCFACQKQLKDWEKEDDPWEEHVKRGNECLFVAFRKKELEKYTTILDFAELYVNLKKKESKRVFEELQQNFKMKENAILKVLEKTVKNKK